MHPTTAPVCIPHEPGDRFAGVQNFTNDAMTAGALITVRIRYSCNLDVNKHSCAPHYDFTRIDEKNDPVCACFARLAATACCRPALGPVALDGNLRRPMRAALCGVQLSLCTLFHWHNPGAGSLQSLWLVARLSVPPFHDALPTFAQARLPVQAYALSLWCLGRPAASTWCHCWWPLALVCPYLQPPCCIGSKSVTPRHRPTPCRWVACGPCRPGAAGARHGNRRPARHKVPEEFSFLLWSQV